MIYIDYGQTQGDFNLDFNFDFSIFPDIVSDVLEIPRTYNTEEE